MSVILFDMDGTLVDTEPIYQRMWMQAAADYGVMITPEMALDLRSMGKPYVQEWFYQLTGTYDLYEKILARRRKIMAEYIAAHPVQMRPEVDVTLAELKRRGHFMAVVSGSPVERIEDYMAQVGIREYFACLVSPQLVKEGKPSPDVYLYACEQLGVAPQDAYAVEDAPNGVLSALRAGCKTIMVPHQTPPEDAWRDQLYAAAEHFGELLDLIR